MLVLALRVRCSGKEQKTILAELNHPHEEYRTVNRASPFDPWPHRDLSSEFVSCLEKVLSTSKNDDS